MVNFIKLHTTEDILVSEYMNLVSAVDSLHLLVTHKDQSKEPFAEVVKKLLKETNFILNFSEKEIEELAIKVKDILCIQIKLKSKMFIVIYQSLKV